MGALLLGPGAQGVAPHGYEVAGREDLGPGVEHVALKGTAPDQLIRVARIARDAPFALRAVPANGGVGGGLERTSSICRRTACLAAVNGDFWQPRTGVPIGGLLSGGQLLKAPRDDHRQLVLPLDGPPTPGDLLLRGTLVSTDLRAVGIDAVDGPLHADGVTLFTRAHGENTPPSEPRVDLHLQVPQPNGPLHLSRTTIVRATGLSQTTDPAPIPPDGAVLSGHGRGAQALTTLWQRIQNRNASPDVLLRLESTPEAVDSIGGNPILVKDGQSVAPDDLTSFVRGRHPRTLVGRTASDEALLVTVDGRQPGYSEGMSLHEAAHLMIELGAVDAINLDGGGSTTFVARGQVVNRPSDRAVRSGENAAIVNAPEDGHQVMGNVERPVAVALALVSRSEEDTPGTHDLLRDLEMPPVLDLAIPQSSDPASDPSGSLPALVIASPPGTALLPIVLVALMSAFALAVGSVAAWERRLRRPVLKRLPPLKSAGLGLLRNPPLGRYRPPWARD